MKSVLARFVAIHHYGHISSTDLDLQHLSHPDYSSIKSITDTLEYYGIANVAVHVPKSSLDQLPQYFLAFFEETESESYALVTKKKNKVHLFLESGRSITVSEEEFQNVWSGHIIAIESAERRTNAKADPTLIYALTAIAVISLIQWQSYSPFNLIMTALAIGGLYFSYLAIKQELGIYSEAAAKVCGAVNNQNTCADVVKSGKGRLFGIVSLADLSVIYFTTLILVYSTIGNDSSFNTVLGILSAPIILFSIYQQAFALKQWCILCLIVIGIVLAQSATILLIETLSIKMNWTYMLKALFIGGGVTIAWSSLKMGIKNTKVLKETKQEFLKFKRNPKLFSTLLQELKAETDISREHQQLVFGAKDPVVSVIGITNPFCSHCVNSAMSYDTVLGLLRDKVSITLVFNVSSDLANTATAIAARIIEIYYKEGPEASWTAIQDWYANRDREAWHKTYGTSQNTTEYCVGVLNSHRDFCKNNRLTYTPVTIIDKQLFPYQYNIGDLPLMLDQLIGNLAQENISK